jgi:hypothetical protein
VTSARTKVKRYFRALRIQLTINDRFEFGVGAC